MDGKQFAKLLRKRDIKVNRFEFHGREFDVVIENGRVEVTDKDTGEKHIRTKEELWQRIL